MTSLEIEAFLTVQRTGSISKAADFLYISQSSLSTRLRTLERELGCSLFARSKGSRVMVLTPEGKQFLPLARQHRDLEKKMLALGKGVSTEQRLRISALNSIGNYLLPIAYQRFTELHPDIRLEIQDMTTMSAMEAIAWDKLDMTFSALSISTEYITAIPFLSEPMTILCAANSDYPDPVPLHMLSSDQEVYSNWCADVDQWHQSAFGTNAQPQVHLELMSQIQLFLSKPGAWMVVPYSIADTLEKTPNLRRLRTDFPIPNRQLYVLCNRKTRDSEPVILFLDCLRSVLQEQKIPGLLL